MIVGHVHTCRKHAELITIIFTANIRFHKLVLQKARQYAVKVSCLEEKRLLNQPGYSVNISEDRLLKNKMKYRSNYIFMQYFLTGSQC